MPTAAEIATVLYKQWMNDVNDVQRKSKESPEFYRETMYTLLPGAEQLDMHDDDRYWEIVLELEKLFVNKPEKLSPTRQDFVTALAQQLVTKMEQGADIYGLTLSDYDIDSYEEMLDELILDIKRTVQYIHTDRSTNTSS